LNLENYQQFFGLLSMAFAKLEISQDFVRVGGNSSGVKSTMRGLGKNGKERVAEGISVFELNEAGKIEKVSSSGLTQKNKGRSEKSSV
jgi:hypothetical protein